MIAPVLALLVAAAPAAAPSAEAGARAEGEAWTVELRPAGPVRGGATGSAQVVVAARPGYHVNRDYPMSFRPGAGGTAVFAAERLPLGEGAVRSPCPGEPGEACAVSAPLRFTAAASGQTRIAGVVSFSVCNADRCLIERIPLLAVVPAR